MADGTPALLAVARYLLFVATAVVPAGVVLQRLAGVAWEPALVLPIGLVFCALGYWLSLASGIPLLFPALAAGAVLLLLLRARSLGRPASGPSLRGALPAVALLVVLFALTQYRVNRVDRSGAFLLDVGEHADTALHVGVSWELVAGYPPQVPGLAGVTMHYHVGSHLVRAAAAQWAGIHPYDAMTRFDITLWAIALVLALRAAAFALGFGPGLVAIAGFLPLAADLSFLPGLALGVPWWALRLGDTLVEALFFANSITPALALALGAIVALARWERGEGRGWLALAAALAAGTGFFKVFTGAQLLLSLGAALLLRRRLGAAVAVLLPGGMALLTLALGSASPAGASGVSVTLAPLSAANPAREAFGLPPVHGLLWLVSGLAWLSLSLGFRVVGVPRAWGAARRGGAALASLGMLALSGWPLAALVSITADPDCDESFYFLQASGLVLWVFVAAALLSAKRRRPLALALAAALCLPSTVEFVVRKARSTPEALPPAAVRAMSVLRAESCPGDVVITRPRPRYVPLPVVLAGRRVAFSNYIGYWRQFISPARLHERDRLVRSFFRSTSPDAAVEIARELGARFVYLTGRQKVDFDTRGVLVPLFEDGGERVYRIVPAGPGTCEPPAAATGLGPR